MCESAIVVIVKLAENRSSENSKARKDARLDLCRLPRFLLNGWRVGNRNCGRLAALAAAAGRGMAARVPETQNGADGMRDAGGDRSQKFYKVFYKWSCPQHVRMLSSLSVTHAFSAAVPTRI